MLILQVILVQYLAFYELIDTKQLNIANGSSQIFPYCSPAQPHLIKVLVACISQRKMSKLQKMTNIVLVLCIWKKKKQKSTNYDDGEPLFLVSYSLSYIKSNLLFPGKLCYWNWIWKEISVTSYTFVFEEFPFGFDKTNLKLAKVHFDHTQTQKPPSRKTLNMSGKLWKTFQI